MTRVNYDALAANYHNRYQQSDLLGVAATLTALVPHLPAPKILEVGCGTGRWLQLLRAHTPQVYGLDFSFGMLSQAQQQDPTLYLTRGTAAYFPYPSAAFDFVFCVNALHHFESPSRFFMEAYRVLKAGGAFITIGIDPREIRQWYLYDYFQNVRETDLQRFPALATIQNWAGDAGFAQVERRVVDQVHDQKIGRAILADHFFQKYGSSQLTLLSEAAYEAGVSAIKAALTAAEAQGEEARFKTEFDFVGVSGLKK